MNIIKKTKMKNLVLVISGVILLFSCKKEINSGTLKSISNESAIERVDVISAVASTGDFQPQQYRYAVSGSRKLIYGDSVFGSKATYFKGMKLRVRTSQPVGMINFQLTINNQNIPATYTYVNNDTISILPTTPIKVVKRSWYAVRANISGSPLTTYSISWNELLLTKTIEDNSFIPVENISWFFGVTCDATEFK